MVASTANRPPQTSKSFTSHFGNGDGSDFCYGAFQGRDRNSLPSPIIGAVPPWESRANEKRR
jgi:hypothetical protein